jgi:hypothetical protein
MAICHDEVVITDHGLALTERTAMHGHKLSQHTVVADERPGLFSVELQILRDSTNDSRREHMAILTQLGVPADGSAGINDTTITYLYVLVNEHERTDLYILAYLGFGMNTC